MYIVQEHFIGQWQDVGEVKGKPKTQQEAVKAFKDWELKRGPLDRPTRLVERTEVVLKTGEEVWIEEEKREDKI